jgi:hypothetical protein
MSSRGSAISSGLSSFWGLNSVAWIALCRRLLRRPSLSRGSMAYTKKSESLVDGPPSGGRGLRV